MKKLIVLFAVGSSFLSLVASVNASAQPFKEYFVSEFFGTRSGEIYAVAKPESTTGDPSTFRVFVKTKSGNYKELAVTAVEGRIPDSSNPQTYALTLKDGRKLRSGRYSRYFVHPGKIDFEYLYEPMKYDVTDPEYVQARRLMAKAAAASKGFRKVARKGLGAAAVIGIGAAALVSGSSNAEASSVVGDSSPSQISNTSDGDFGPAGAID